MKTILVGMSPIKGDPKEPLSGPSGRRLAALAGLDLDDFLSYLERVNLVVDGKRDVASVIAKADALREKWKGRNVILLGRQVAAAFRLNPDGYEYFQMQALEPGFEAAVCPHPSEKTHWWNEPVNVERAREFMLRLKLGFLETRRRGKEMFSVDQIAAALDAGRGVFSWSAEALAEASGRSCTAQTIKNYIDKYPDELVHVGHEARLSFFGRAIKNVVLDVEAGGIDTSKWALNTRAAHDMEEALGIKFERVVHARHSGHVSMEHRHEIDPVLAAALRSSSVEELEVLQGLFWRIRIEGEAEVLEIAEADD